MKNTSKDKAAPKSKGKNTSKDKAAKQPGPKLVEKDIVPAIGHNQPTGEKNPRAVELLTELMKMQEQKKALAKAERDVRNALKSECGILASSVAREVALRKLDADVRVQVETNHEDFKKMLGYQPELDFAGTKPTDASVKAQPSEAELDKHDPEPKRAAKPEPKGFTVADDDNEENDDSASEKDGVITREG